MENVPCQLERIGCPQCGSERSTVVRSARGAGGEMFDIVRCDACGQHCTNPRPVIESLGRYYDAAYSPYQSEKGSPAGDEGSLRSLVLRDAFGPPALRPTGSRRLLARAVRAVRPAESFAFGIPYRGRGRLLDFGCGAGKFLGRMHALGWEVTGLDFSATAVAAVRAKGLRAVQGTLLHPELAAGSFDAVTMRQVLEHLPEPRRAIRCAWDLLDHGGLLLIQVPNFASWDVDFFGEAAMELDLPRHLNHFTPATLRAMIASEVSGPVDVRQTAHPSWIRKGAERSTERSWRNQALRFPLACRGAALLSRVAGRANEIVASAVKS